MLLAVGFWVSSGSAAASCGDYVTILGSPTAHGTEPMGHSMPSVPCHGPGCSAAPTSQPMPLATPPTAELGAKEVAARSLHESTDSGEPRHANNLSDDGRPVSRPSAPFHPPRV